MTGKQERGFLPIIRVADGAGVGRQVLGQRRVGFPAIAEDQLVENQDCGEGAEPDDVAAAAARRPHEPALAAEAVFTGAAGAIASSTELTVASNTKASDGRKLGGPRNSGLRPW
jgi:hypothetical protein